MTPISVVLITLNAERHLERVLASVSGFASEIVILDSGSTDGTAAIARRFDARVVVRPFAGYGPQKRAAVALANHEWVLSLDGDEVLDPQAQDFLRTFTPTDTTACWRIRRRNHVGPREIRHGHWSPDWCLRLFNRSRHNFSEALVHEAVHPTGPVHTLPGSLLHFGYTDLIDVFRMPYHRLKADAARAKDRRPGSLNLLGRAAWTFFNSYVLRNGWRDGQAGVVVAMSSSLNAVLGLASAAWDEPAATHIPDPGPSRPK